MRQLIVIQKFSDFSVWYEDIQKLIASEEKKHGVKFPDNFAVMASDAPGKSDGGACVFFRQNACTDGRVVV